MPGLLHDRCRAVHAAGVASPFLRSLGLERCGMRWARPEIEPAHPLDSGLRGDAALPGRDRVPLRPGGPAVSRRSRQVARGRPPRPRPRARPERLSGRRHGKPCCGSSNASLWEQGNGSSRSPRGPSRPPRRTTPTTGAATSSPVPPVRSHCPASPAHPVRPYATGCRVCIGAPLPPRPVPGRTGCTATRRPVRTACGVPAPRTPYAPRTAVTTARRERGTAAAPGAEGRDR